MAAVSMQWAGEVGQWTVDGELEYLGTWVDEAFPPCRRVAATSSRQCGWPCPSRTCLLAPAWPRTCYILSLIIFALKCSLLFANFKSSGSLFHGSTTRTAKEYFRGSVRANFCTSLYSPSGCLVLVLLAHDEPNKSEKCYFKGLKLALKNFGRFSSPTASRAVLRDK